MTDPAVTTIACTHCGSRNNELHAKAKDVEYFTSEEQFYYFHCNDCSVLFLFPQPNSDLQKIYPPNYYSFRSSEKGWAFRIKEKLDRRFLAKHLGNLSQPSLSVLDIGGGHGELCDTIKKADRRISKTQIVDIDAGAAAAAVKNGHRYFCGRIEDFNSPDLYEVILLLNLIEHVADPVALLDKAGKLLSPGGIIIIKTPNYKSFDAKLFRHDSWGGYHCPRHWIIFNKENLLALAGKCGLTAKYFCYTQGTPFWTVNILHQLQKWNLINASAERPLVYHPLFGPISMIMAAFDFVRKPFAALSQMFVVLKHAEK